MQRFDTDETRAFWEEACAATGIDPGTTHHAGTFAGALDAGEWPVHR